jgi:hypothetical protein
MRMLSNPTAGAARRLALACLFAAGALAPRPARAETPPPPSPPVGTEAATSASTPARNEAPPSKPRRRAGGPFGPTLAVNPQHLRLFDIPINALELEAGFGLRSALHEKVFVSFVGGALLGQTEAGLGVHRFTLSAKVERQFDGFHVGLMGGLGAFVLGRARGDTNENSVLSSKLYVGPEFKLSGDLATLSIDATFAADLLPGGEQSKASVMYGPGVSLGVRFY